MQIISVINYKGGVGKTTVTANLAGELAYRGKKVLLLDMDAQASLTFSFVSPDYWKNNLEKSKTIKKWFDCIVDGEAMAPISSLIIRPEEVNSFARAEENGGVVDLIASHLGLINVDLELATLLGGANMDQTRKKYIKVHGKLRSEIQNVASNEYDVVLIDCPPNFNIVTKNALVASDKILIPAKPDYLSTLGIDYLCRSVRDLIKEFNGFAKDDANTKRISPKFLGVIFTMIQKYGKKPITAQRQFITQTRNMASDHNIPVMDSIFRENKTVFSNPSQDGVPVVLKSYPNNTHKRVVSEIETFVDEFIAKTGV